MKRLWLEIQRASGETDKRSVSSEVGSLVATADGACPGCSAMPFLVKASGSHIHDRDTLRFGGVCAGCGDNVGWIYLTLDTIFGSEEDRAVLEFGRARVYR
jgi:hypothetical protein